MKDKIAEKMTDQVACIKYEQKGNEEKKTKQYEEKEKVDKIMTERKIEKRYSKLKTKQRKRHRNTEERDDPSILTYSMEQSPS